MSRFSTDTSLIAAQNSSLDVAQAAWQASTGAMIEQEINRQQHSWSRDGLFTTLGKAAMDTGLPGLFGYDSGTGTGIDAVSNYLSDYGLGVQNWRVNLDGDQPARDDLERIQIDRESIGLGMTSRTFNSLAFGLAGRQQGFDTFPQMIAIYGHDEQGKPFDTDTLRNMAEAGSEIEIAYLRALALRKQEVAARTARVPGVVNFGVSMAAGFTDPVMLASGAAAGAVGRPIAGLALSDTAGTLRRLVVNGVASGGENIAQNVVLSNINKENYTAHQAVTDFSLGLAFSGVFEGIPEGAKAAIKAGNGSTRMQVALAGLETTPKGDAYFSEVPGHTPTATAPDLVNADRISAAALFNDTLSGEPVSAPKWLVGRDVYVDGLNESAKVVRVEGGDVVVDAGGREVRAGMDGVALRRTDTFTEGARVQLRDGTTGTVHAVGPDTVTVRPDTEGQSVAGESRVVNQSDLILKQGSVRIQRGQISFDGNGRAVISFLKAKNASTLAHESGHLFRRTLRDIDANAADELNGLFNETHDEWSVESEEQFARLFEKYVREGTAPTEGLRAVFAKFKSWMADLIDTAKGLKLTDKHREVFGILLDSKADKPVIGTLDGPEGVMYRKVRGELDKVLTDRTEADAVDALIQANAKAWSRATGKPIGAYYRDVLVGFTDTKAAPSRNGRVLAQEDATDAPEVPTDSRVLVLQKGLGAGRAWKAFGIIPRLTRAGILKGNDSAIGNQIVSWLMDDPTIDQSGTRNVSTVEANARMNREAIFGTYARDIRSAIEEHLKPLGIAAKVGGKEADAFLRKVGDIVGDPNGKADSPAMEKAVAATRSALRDLLKLGKAAGIKGFDKFDANDFYFTRRWDHVRILNLIGEIDKAGGNGKAEVTELLAKAFLDNNPNATDIDEARVLADAFLQRLQQVSRAGPLDKAMLAINLDNAGIMREVLTEAGTDPAIIENIMRRFAIPTEGTNLLPQAKFRTRLNDRATHTTAGGRTLSMTDLLDTNALNVVEAYTHGVTAEAALTRLRKAVAELTADPEKGPVEIDSDAQLLVRYKKALEKDGNLGTKAVNRNVWLMETAIKRIKGLPIDEGGTMSDMLWRFRAFNSITGSAGFGVSAAFEMAGSVARVGLKPMAQHFPEMVEFSKNLRTGQPNDALTRTILSSLGLGQDMATNRLLLDMGLTDDAMAPRSEKIVGKIDSGLSVGRRLVSEWSGMPQITAISRVWAARGMLQRISDQVRTGKMPSAKRLASLGLDEASWNAIAKQIKEYAKHTDTKLTDLNLDSWTDLSAKQKMLAAVRDATLTTIQESSVGNSHPWLETELGRTIFQFRQFAAAALEKQLYSNIQVMDGESAALFISGPVLGLMQYLAMTYINGIGRDDRKEYWERMTTPTRLGLAAFSRASFTSIAPTLYDTGAVSLGYPTLGGFRASGMESDPILGNPTLTLLTQGRRGLFSPVRAMVDSNYDFSKDDARAMRLLIPMNRFPGMTSIYNKLINDLPAKSQPEFGN